MTETEALRIIRTHLERQFPKRCPSCGLVYRTLREYVLGTRNVGDPVSYDGEAGNLRPAEPMGTVALANCRCGSTMTLSSRGLGRLTHWRLLWWARKEVSLRRTTWSKLLGQLRAQLAQQVLEDGDPSLRAHGTGGR